MTNANKQKITTALGNKVEKEKSFWDRFPPENSFDESAKKLGLERAAFISSSIASGNFSPFTVEGCDIWVKFPDEDQSIMIASGV